MLELNNVGIGVAMTIVLGVNKIVPLPNHDSAVTIVKDGKILASVQEERITRVKHDGSVPYNAIKECIRIAGISPEEIDAIAQSTQQFWLPPLRSFFKYRTSLKNYAYTFPVAFLKRMIIKKIKDYFGLKCKGYYVNHHLSHAASAYYTSGYTSGTKDCISFALDGGGDYRAGGMFRNEDDALKELNTFFPMNKSIGYFYSAVADILGFHSTDGEGKVMGLASYGKPLYVKELEDILKHNTANLTGVEIDFNDKKKFSRYRYDRIYLGDKFKSLITGDGRDLAASAQKLLENNVVNILKKAVEKEGVRKIALAGGIFFNCKLNKLIREEIGTDEIFIHPAAGDAGVQTGAAFEVCRRLDPENFKPEKMEHVYYGTEYDDEEILAAIKNFGMKYEELKDPSGTAADLINKGMVVGWFQGKMEYGPRALGNRSVLADPTDAKIRDKINSSLKQRDWFMPFAPSMLYEAKDEYLVDAIEAPFMIMAFDVPKEKIKEIPAVVHVDGTARPQTVKKEVNPKYWKLIKEFEKYKVPVVLNTSFNKHGLPIVMSPEDALEHLVWKCIDVLIIGNYIVERKLN